MNVYDFTALDGKNNPLPLQTLKGKLTIIVNVASKCGFTPQYAELEDIYKTYKDQGLEILGFPCNQFLFQEPGTHDEIQQFCQLNYGVTFPILAKINVNGSKADPLYQYLTNSDLHSFGGKIKWNFTKFLIDKEGNVLERFDAKTSPTKMIPSIQAAL